MAILLNTYGSSYQMPTSRDIGNDLRHELRRCDKDDEEQREFLWRIALSGSLIGVWKAFHRTNVRTMKKELHWIEVPIEKYNSFLLFDSKEADKVKALKQEDGEWIGVCEKEKIVRIRLHRDRGDFYIKYIQYCSSGETTPGSAATATATAPLVKKRRSDDC